MKVVVSNRQKTHKQQLRHAQYVAKHQKMVEALYAPAIPYSGGDAKRGKAAIALDIVESDDEQKSWKNGEILCIQSPSGLQR